MKPDFIFFNLSLYHANCLEVSRSLPENSIDSIVTDPPYGLKFMGKDWDHGVPGVDYWKAFLRVAKPGGHLLAFGGTRTNHRLMVAMEDAGWEIRDTIMWVYGSGFPKSHNGPWGGTALKPAWEPITVGRKPLIGTVAANVLEYGTGGLNVDVCRISLNGESSTSEARRKSTFGGRVGEKAIDSDAAGSINRRGDPAVYAADHGGEKGRWPANLIHDGSEEAIEPLGSAARFFYCAKANKKDRTENGRVENKHPTVKPTELMRYLVRLVTRKGGVVFDPFMGSGSTGKAAVLEGMRFVGAENDQDSGSFGTAVERLRDVSVREM